MDRADLEDQYFLSRLLHSLALVHPLNPGVPNAAGAPIKPKVPGIPRTPWAQPLLQEQLSLLLAKQAIHENCQELRIFCFLKFS